MRYWKAMLLFLLIAALCLSVCGCGASKAKQEQEKADKTLDVVDEADAYLQRVSGMEGYELFIIQGDYDSKKDVYTVDVAYDTEAMRNALTKDHPALRQSQYASLVDEYVQGLCDTLTENSLDSLMNTLLKDQISSMFSKEELDTAVVVQFTDPSGTTTQY